MYTFEDNLFYKPRKRKSGGWGKWVFVAILILLFVYYSMRPVKRLRAEPPPSFYNYSLTWSKEQRQQERRLALAYWQVAVQRIQTRYSPQRALPPEPPPSFRIGNAASNQQKDMIASRIHYWFKLREVWRQRDAWRVSYEWNTGWVWSTLNSLEQNGPRWFSNGVQSFVEWLRSHGLTIPGP